MSDNSQQKPSETGNHKTEKNLKQGVENLESVVNKDSNNELIMGIPVDVKIILGSTVMPVATLMSLGRGSVITLDKQIGDPVDVVVNGRVVAKGEVIVMEDDGSRFGISLTEVLGT